MAENTKIMRCSNCANNHIEHPFQDSQYNKYFRVFNIAENGTAVCTVCGNGKKKK